MNAILLRSRAISHALLVTAVVDFGRRSGRNDEPTDESLKLLRLGRNLLRSASARAPKASG